MGGGPPFSCQRRLVEVYLPPWVEVVVWFLYHSRSAFFSVFLPEWLGGGGVVFCEYPSVHVPFSLR